MDKDNIDLNQCKRDDILISRNGDKYIYIRKNIKRNHHIIKGWIENEYCYVYDNGKTYNHRECSSDIIKLASIEEIKIESLRELYTIISNKSCYSASNIFDSEYTKWLEQTLICAKK